MARSFNGTSDYLQTNAPITVLPVTISAWFRRRTTGVSVVLASLQAHQGSSNTGIRLTVFSTNVIRVTSITTTGTVASADSTTTYLAGAWQHACGIVASSADRRAFLQGGSKGTNTTSRVIGTPTRFTIGANYVSDALATWYDDVVADVALWDVALLDAEVFALSQGRDPREIQPGALVGFYALAHDSLVGGLERNLSRRAS